MPDDDALVEQIASALRLIVQPAIAAAGDPVKGWALVERAFALARDDAHADGLVATKPETKVRVDGLVVDETGIVSIRHGLGSERVMVRLFNKHDRPRHFRRMPMPISPDEIEVVAESADVAYAEVEVAAE